ncbi:unnamed protein product [Absidia cylindrospora]
MENNALTLSEPSDTDASSTPLQTSNGEYQHQEANQEATQSRPSVLENTINTLDSLGGTTWLDKGNKGNWYIDEYQLLDEPTINNPLSLLAAPVAATSYTTQRPTMPSRKIQRQLIHSYYRHRYPLFHMIPQDLLLQHFDNPGVSISPMLLLAIFAHGAQFDVTDGGTKADGYFDQAKDLLNTVLGVPCLSTVAAFCILSLYEPKLGVDYRSRSVSYSALAFRMCDELGYGQIESRSTGVDDDGGQKELHKRVAWGCYCLDKIQGTCFGHSWMIRLQDMNLDLPRCYWPNEDQEQMECFVAFIKLMQMAEQSLKPNHFMKFPSGGHVDESLAHRLDQDLFHWLQALPLHLHWTPLHTPGPSSAASSSASSPATMPMPSHPPRNAWIAHLHLLFNLVQLRILLPFASPSCLNKLLHQRCMAVATHLTQLTWYMAKQPDHILSYALTGTAIMVATRSHFMNCGHQDSSLAWHARYMFQRGIQSLSILVQQEQRSIPGIDSFLARVEGALHKVDTPNGSLLNGSNMDDTNHMHLTGSEQNAAEVLSHAFGASSTSTSASIWQPTLNNHHEHQYHHLHEEPQHHLSTTTDPLDFLGTTATADTWNQQRMAPSSVDALLYKSRLLLEDQRHQEIASGGLLMSHAKLNDPFLLSSWMMRHSKDLMTTPPPAPSSSSSNSLATASIPSHQPMPTGTTTVADESLFWPQLPLDAAATSTPTATPSPLTTTTSSLKRTATPTPTTTPATAIGMPARSYGQYMNIGLGVYASAHQHHNDVIRQHIPDTPGRKASRPVILTHQGQVIVTPPDNPTPSNDVNANGNAIMG